MKTTEVTWITSIAQEDSGLFACAKGRPTKKATRLRLECPKTNWGWLEKYERWLPSEQKKSNASDDFNGNRRNDSTCCYVYWCVVHGYYSR